MNTQIQAAIEEQFLSTLTPKTRKDMHGFAYRSAKNYFKLLGTPEGMKQNRHTIALFDDNSKDRYHCMYQLVRDIAFAMWNGGTTYNSEAPSMRDILNAGFTEGFEKEWKKQYGDAVVGKDMDEMMKSIGADSIDAPNIHSL